MTWVVLVCFCSLTLIEQVVCDAFQCLIKIWGIPLVTTPETTLFPKLATKEWMRTVVLSEILRNKTTNHKKNPYIFQPLDGATLKK